MLFSVFPQQIAATDIVLFRKAHIVLLSHHRRYDAHSFDNVVPGDASLYRRF